MKDDTSWHVQTDLFVSGTRGYHTYRIPALAVSNTGTLLAFCEGRRYSQSDTGEIDLLLRRSFDGGQNWGAQQVIVTRSGYTCGNPCPVVDRNTGIIWLPFTVNPATVDERAIIAGNGTRTVWLTWSDDDGATWATPREITTQVKDPAWTWYATGPGHGIQLRSGRLLIPCDHAAGRHFAPPYPYHSHVAYSDDHGASWQIGGVVEEGTNECAVVETANGAIYINCRNYRRAGRRAYAWSSDGGDSFSSLQFDETLIEPTCQASLARLTDATCHDRARVIFANPASTTRKRLTVRLSYDECKTWSRGRVLHDGPAAYSDLAVLPDLTICCLYERGTEHPYERLTLARFNIAWLEGTTRSVEVGGE